MQSSDAFPRIAPDRNRNSSVRPGCPGRRIPGRRLEAVPRTIPYFCQGAVASCDQISANSWRRRTSADFFPFTKTSAASPREL